jgi:hypothetical protein
VAILIIGATHAGVGRGGVDDDVVPVHDPALSPCWLERDATDARGGGLLCKRTIFRSIHASKPGITIINVMQPSLLREFSGSTTVINPIAHYIAMARSSKRKKRRSRKSD